MEGDELTSVVEPAPAGFLLDQLSDDDIAEDAIVADKTASPLRWHAADCYAELSRRGWTTRKIGERVGKSHNHVAVCLRAVNLGLQPRPNFQDAYDAAKKSNRGDEQREQPAFPPGTFGLVYADPPWRYDFAATDTRRVENQYPTMDVAEICALEPPFAPDCALYLWATAPKLREALTVMDAWGFEYLTHAVWVKDKIGMGYWFRSRHELLLVGKRGKFSPPEESMRPDSVIEAPRGDHSAKPAVVYEVLDALYPDVPKLELFARQAREGWTAWGKDAPTS